MKEYYLGIDIGTYESRGMLIDENMIPVAEIGRASCRERV